MSPLAISFDAYLRFPLIDTSLASNMLGWHEDNVVFDEHINGKLAESWVYHEISAQADITGDYSITHYRDSDKRTADDNRRPFASVESQPRAKHNYCNGSSEMDAHVPLALHRRGNA